MRPAVSARRLHFRAFTSDGGERSAIVVSGDRSLCPRSEMATTTNKIVTPRVARMYSNGVCSFQSNTKIETAITAIQR